VIDLGYPPGATPLNRDELQGLLLTHITDRGELDRWEQDNVVEALAWLERTKPVDILNERFVRRLHQRMFANVWNWAGQFRQRDKTLGGPWWRISMDLKVLCDDIHWRAEEGMDIPDEIAVCFHHRLVSIHPFPNGNGRHARLMTDVLLENVMNTERFSWGGQELSKTSNVRQQYITGLQEADKGDYKPLLRFVRL
jgi:Fic-DOC domain mobile mystery protein B